MILHTVALLDRHDLTRDFKFYVILCCKGLNWRFRSLWVDDTGPALVSYYVISMTVVLLSRCQILKIDILRSVKNSHKIIHMSVVIWRSRRLQYWSWRLPDFFFYRNYSAILAAVKLPNFPCNRNCRVDTIVSDYRTVGPQLRTRPHKFCCWIMLWHCHSLSVDRMVSVW